jgi:hypothetical protein
MSTGLADIVQTMLDGTILTTHCIDSCKLAGIRERWAGHDTFDMASTTVSTCNSDSVSGKHLRCPLFVCVGKRWS